MTSVILPWPRKVLSPNVKSHWAVKNRATLKAKSDAFYLARDAGLSIIEVYSNSIDVHLTFTQPDKRRRDQDNIIASCKALLDGVAMAIGVDDSRFNLSFDFSPPPKKPGSIIVKIGD